MVAVPLRLLFIDNRIRKRKVTRRCKQYLLRASLQVFDTVFLVPQRQLMKARPTSLLATKARLRAEPGFL